MFNKKKNVQTDMPITPSYKKKDYYPVYYVVKGIEDYQKQMVAKEVESLQELHEVEVSFDEVLQENANLRETLGSFTNVFDAVGTKAVPRRSKIAFRRLVLDSTSSKNQSA